MLPFLYRFRSAAPQARAESEQASEEPRSQEFQLSEQEKIVETFSWALIALPVAYSSLPKVVRPCRSKGFQLCWSGGSFFFEALRSGIFPSCIWCPIPSSNRRLKIRRRREMEGLMLVKRVPSPGLAVGREVAARNHLPAAKVSALGARAASASGGSAVEASAAKQSYKLSMGLRRLWPREGVASAEEGEEVTSPEKAEELKIETAAGEQRQDDWVSKILKSMWAEREERTANGDREASAMGDGDRCVGCSCSGSGVGEADDSEGCFVGDEVEEKMEFDRESFSRLLRRVPLLEMEVYSKMATLGSLAYIVSMIKPKNLLRCYRLRFVTSSLEEKAKPSNSEKEQEPSQDLKLKEESRRAEEDDKNKENSFGISASTATHLQSQTMRILPEISENGEDRSVTSLEASFVAAMNSVTAVGAGEEEMEQAVVKDLKSSKSLPCEWFICDDDKTATRYFIIQGSETLASWQTNLLFEPVQFEGMDVPVHRGIYEAAKGMYQQMLPEVRAHLKAHGKSATLRFTGHSLGGSLSVLVSLMLLIRGEATAESLLPVITFGAPSIMCGGDNLLRKLGLPKSHVHAITMHRDIVPRAFSCNYPDHVAQILKAVNGNFRNHPCLKNQKLLYGPMGKLLILQPEEKFSPCHHLLPPGSGLYNLDNSLKDSGGSEKTLRAATLAFLNSPHPLEILSDCSAYGSEGTVYRDHDTNSYLRSVRAVMRKEIKLIRKARREQRRKVWWPLVATDDVLHGGAVTTSTAGAMHSTQHQFSFAGVFHAGRQALSRFRRLVASQHVYAFVVLFFPARLLLFGAFSIVYLS